MCMVVEAMVLHSRGLEDNKRVQKSPIHMLGRVTSVLLRHQSVRRRIVPWALTVAPPIYGGPPFETHHDHSPHTLSLSPSFTAKLFYLAPS